MLVLHQSRLAGLYLPQQLEQRRARRQLHPQRSVFNRVVFS
jgi:hypothetical protein